ncbi:MAG TPA: hypothetical protein PKY56_03325 [Candidatus Kapabacteria bacterium]|nr:hypothetical protein [Candidatus Kapabacteria bacterium]HPO63174.1 hypothetical protein [Candidatus Kapabacteria bacterium]
MFTYKNSKDIFMKVIENSFTLMNVKKSNYKPEFPEQGRKLTNFFISFIEEISGWGVIWQSM